MRTGKNSHWWWALVGVVLVAGTALRLYRIAEPMAGYHLTNEVFYVNQGIAELKRGVLEWFTNPLDFNNPPLYGLLVQLLFRAFEPTVIWGRLISVAAAALAGWFTFRLGETLYDRRIGGLSALFVMFAPGFALVGRNAQVDALFVALMTGAVYYYALSARKDRTWTAVVSGALLGLAVLAKQPAVLVVPALMAWETWRAGKLSWLRAKRAIAFAVAFVVVGAPWYVWQAVASGGKLFGSVTHVVTANQAITQSWSDFVLRLYIGEFAGMMWAPVAAVFLAGVAVLASKRSAGDKLVLVLLAVFAVYYAAFHFHSYYLVMLLPFAAIAVGRGVALALREGGRAAQVGTAILVVGVVLAAAVSLSSHKWGKWSPAILADGLDIPGRRLHVFVEDSARLNYQGALGYYRGDIAVSYLPTDQALPPKNADKKRAVLLLSPPMRAEDGQFAPIYRALSEDTVRPVLFGYAIGASADNMHLFAFGPWSFEQVGYPYRFGMLVTPKDALLRLYDPERLR